MNGLNEGRYRGYKMEDKPDIIIDEMIDRVKGVRTRVALRALYANLGGYETENRESTHAKGNKEALRSDT